MKPPIIRTAEDFTWERYRDAFFKALPTRERRAFEAWAKTFYRFQSQWLFEPEDYAAGVKSRQIGYSHTTGGLGAMWGVAFGETTTFVSVGEREAKEVLEKAKRHAAMLRAFGSQWATIRGKDSAEEVRFASGGRIVALPQTSGGRSFSGNVFLDEYAYLQNPKVVWDGASAVSMHGYKLRVASTPNGVGNNFHQLITDPVQHAGYALHSVSIHQAIADGMNVDIDRCWKMAKGDPRLFSQLFECGFLDGELQYIPTEMVDRATVDDLYTWEGECYAGLDIGRTNDLTALVIVRMVGEVAKLVCLLTCKRTEQENLDALVARAFNVYGVTRLFVDATGIGAFPAERMQKQFGRTRVVPVTFTQQSKEDMATTAYAFFADSKVQIPRQDSSTHECDIGGAQALRTDICSIKRIVTSAGNIRYDAPHTDEGHADRAWALFMALCATGRRPSIKIIDATR